MTQQLESIFNAQKAHHFHLRTTTAKDRISRLRLLKKSIKKYEQDVYTALQNDLRKSEFEAAVTEFIFVLGELDFAIKNLSKWMLPKRIGKTWSNLFAKNRVRYEPKGVCLIIAPWNYPFQLTMSPLIPAIAAGNCVIVKPSELSVATSNVVAKILADTFDESEVACVLGDANTSTTLLTFPFDHIFFTGSTTIGKIVMEAAAKNLSSVTLELGGKSPTIIDQDVDLEKAAEKIAWGKLVNSGQTCIAPDYVFVHEKQLDQFIGFYKSSASKLFFKEQDRINERAYGKIVNAIHFNRLKNLTDDAIAQGARINWGGTFDTKTQTINPIVLSKIPVGTKIMEEEVFGPILPVLTYQNLAEAIDYINSKSKPLALYIFSRNKKNIESIIQHTSAGGTCVNDVLIHISNPKLPFGGVNGSGMGSSHGFYGFKNFSHERALVYQRRIDFTTLIYPPYLDKDWVLKLLKKIT